MFNNFRVNNVISINFVLTVVMVFYIQNTIIFVTSNINFLEK